MLENKRTKLGFTHFASDHHFCHKNIISYCNRPFIGVDHQISELVRRHNETVSPDDHTLFNGDLFINSQISDVLSRMNGKKTLVVGNHDMKMTTTKLLSLGFESVHRVSLFDEIDGTPVCYNHFPHVEGYEGEKYVNLRPLYEPDTILIHGHTHSVEKTSRHHTVHVGVDAWDYRPATFVEVRDLVKFCLEQRKISYAKTSEPEAQ